MDDPLTQEWTPSTLLAIWKQLNYDDDFRPSKRFLINVCDAHNAALDSEREKLRGELANGTELFRQLLQAQAAIAEHNKRWPTKDQLGCDPIRIDLSTLDKHDEEVRRLSFQEG